MTIDKLTLELELKDGDFSVKAKKATDITAGLASTLESIGKSVIGAEKSLASFASKVDAASEKIKTAAGQVKSLGDASAKSKEKIDAAAASLSELRTKADQAATGMGRIAKSSEQARDSLAGFNTNVRAASSTVVNLERSFSKIVTKADALRESIASTSTAFRSAEAAVQRMERRATSAADGLKKLRDETSSARAEISKFGAHLAQADTHLVNFRNASRNAANAAAQIASSIRNVPAALQHITAFSAQMTGITQSMAQIQNTLRSVVNGVAAVGQSASTTSGHWGGLMGRMRDFAIVSSIVRSAIFSINDAFVGWQKNILDTTGKYEKLQILLQGTGKGFGEERVKQAADEMKFLQEQAQKVPFSVDAISKAFVKFKVADIQNPRRMIEGLAGALAGVGATSEQFDRASIAIQQMASKGVISMEELRQQLSEAFPQALQTFSIALGTSVADLTDKISKGMVPAKEALERWSVLLNIISAGKAQELMKTWPGLMAQMSTSWELFQKKIGDARFMDAAKRQIEDLLAAFKAGTLDEFAARVGNSLADVILSLRRAFDFVVKFWKEISTAAVVIGKFILVTKGMSILSGILLGLTNQASAFGKSFSAIFSLALLGDITKLNQLLGVTEIRAAAATAGFSSLRTSVTILGTAIGALAGPIGLIGVGLYELIDRFDLFGAKAHEALSKVGEDLDILSEKQGKSRLELAEMAKKAATDNKNTAYGLKNSVVGFLFDDKSLQEYVAKQDQAIGQANEDIRSVLKQTEVLKNESYQRDLRNFVEAEEQKAKESSAASKRQLDQLAQAHAEEMKSASGNYELQARLDQEYKTKSKEILETAKRQEVGRLSDSIAKMKEADEKITAKIKESGDTRVNSALTDASKLLKDRISGLSEKLRESMDLLDAGINITQNKFEGYSKQKIGGGGKKGYGRAANLPPEVNAIVERKANQYGVDPDFVKAIISAETGENSSITARINATSNKGAQGVMQIMPSTAKRLGIANPRDPEQNIDGGVRYLAKLLAMFGGDKALAAAGYNAGEGAVQKYGNRVPPYKETQGYVKKVMEGFSGLQSTGEKSTEFKDELAELKSAEQTALTEIQESEKTKLAVLETSYRLQKISARKYWDDKLEIQKNATKDQIAELTKQRSQIDEYLKTAPTDHSRSQAEKQKQAIDRQLIQLRQQSKRDEADAIEGIGVASETARDKLQSLAVVMGRLSGDDVAAGLGRVAQRVKEWSEAAKTLDGAERERVEGEIARAKELLIAQETVVQSVRREQRERALLSAQREVARAQNTADAQSGSISFSEQLIRESEFNRQQADDLERIIGLRQKEIDLYKTRGELLSDAGLRAQTEIANARAELIRVKSQTDLIGTQFKNDVANGLSGFFEGVLTRSKSLGQALTDMINQVGSSMIRMISDDLAKALLRAAAGEGLEGFTQGIFGWINKNLLGSIFGGAESGDSAENAASNVSTAVGSISRSLGAQNTAGALSGAESIASSTFNTTLQTTLSSFMTSFSTTLQAFLTNLQAVLAGNSATTGASSIGAGLGGINMPTSTPATGGFNWGSAFGIVGSLVSIGTSIYAATSANSNNRRAKKRHGGGLMTGGDFMNVPESVFLGAPKFHSGKALKRNEVSAILEDTEGVFTKDQMSALAPVSMIQKSASSLVGGGMDKLSYSIDRLAENLAANSPVYKPASLAAVPTYRESDRYMPSSNWVSPGILGKDGDSNVRSGASGDNVSISINVSDSGDKTNSSGDSGKNWGAMAEKVKVVVREELTKQKRNGGMLSSRQ